MSTMSLTSTPSHPANLLFSSAKTNNYTPSLFSAFSARPQLLSRSPFALSTMLDSAFNRLSELSGTPPDYVRLFTLFLASYPLALPLSSLNPTQKHLYSLAITTVFLGPIMNLWSGYAQLIGTSLATYFIAKNKIGGKRMPWIVMFLQMGHLICNHLARELNGVPLTTIEITAMQMVLTMNLTTFAWDIFDGQSRTEEQCDAQQKESRIVQFPSLLEFAGYVSYFPGVLIGPSTRFNDYIAWARGDLYARARAADPAAEQAAQAKGAKVIKRTPPPSGRFPAAAKELLIGIVATALFSMFGATYTYEKLILPASQGGFADRSVLAKIGLMQVAGLAARLKYYGIWSLTNVSRASLKPPVCVQAHTNLTLLSSRRRVLASCPGLHTMASSPMAGRNGIDAGTSTSSTSSLPTTGKSCLMPGTKTLVRIADSEPVCSCQRKAY